MASQQIPPTELAEAYMRAPIPTPHWGAQGGSAFTITATAKIKADVQTVLDNLLETSTWPVWNNFVPRATLTQPESNSQHSSRLHVGTRFTEHVDMAGRGRSTIVKMKLLMTTEDEIQEPDRHGYRVVWLGKGYPDWALRSERVHEIYQTEKDGQTVYHVYETFSGPLAFAVKLFVGSALVDRFRQWNAELKQYAEGKTLSSPDQHVGST